MKKSILLPLLFIYAFAFAQPGAYLVKDIWAGQSKAGSGPEEFTTMGSHVFFNGYLPHSVGAELFVTDGTSTGTKLLVDIMPGTTSSDPEEFVVLNGVLYFHADGALDEELWRSDGTASGTYMVKDIKPGTSGSYPEELTVVNGKIFFVAENNATGRELWISDGTETGTTLVKDMMPGIYGSYPEHLTRVGNKVFFIAEGTATGDELWVSDGTTAGTFLVKDILPGTSSSYIDEMTDVNGTLFFVADNGTDGEELWKSDGTPAGTVMIKDIMPGASSSSISDAASFNGSLYFSASDTSPSNRELWKSDGTAAGTVLVKDINSTGSSVPRELIVSGGKLYFTAQDGITGNELWVSDGTSAGTQLVMDINPGAANSWPDDLFDFNGTLLFTATDGSNQQPLYKTTGTPSMTTLIKSIPGGSFDLEDAAILGNKVIFGGTDNSGNEPWITDGTAAGTTILANIAPDVQSSTPINITAAGNRIFFSAKDSLNYLYSSNGSSGNATQLVGLLGLGLLDIGTHDDKVLFNAITNVAGFELHISDGTVAGTTVLKDLVPGPNHGSPGNFTPLHSSLTLFTDGKYKLWKTDGTLSGTDTFASSLGSVYNMFSALGKVYLSASNSSVTGALFRTDGTTAGTQLVKDINPHSHDQLNFYIEWNGKLYFGAADSASNVELWKTDGTAAGTELVKEINPTHNGAFLNSFVALNNRLVFSADDGTTGSELWTSDGTAAGTVLLKDIYPGTDEGDPKFLTEINGNAVFTAIDAQHGRELWITDGTAAGTQLLKDIFPGTPSGVLAFPNRFIKIGNLVFFAADDGTNGMELWQTDGTAAGTKMAANIETGPAGSFPLELVAADNVLYFSAFTTTYGRELWAYDPGPIGIEEIFTSSLSIYPNPAHDKVIVEVGQHPEAVEVYDLFGRLIDIIVTEPQNSNTEISVTHYPAGTYIVKAGNHIGKFVKH